MAKVNSLDIFKKSVKGAKEKEAANCIIAAAGSFTFGAYIQYLENIGAIDKKTKWTLFALFNGVAWAACAAQHYQTSRKCLNVIGEVPLNDE